jgi:hypothetical protein
LCMVYLQSACGFFIDNGSSHIFYIDQVRTFPMIEKVVGLNT